MGTKLVSYLIVLTLVGSASAELVGYWKLNDGAGTTATDSSGNGNNGTLVGAPQWVAGLYGGALQFNGQNSYVEIPTSDSLEIHGQVTVAAWVNWMDAGDAWLAILANGQQNGPWENYGLFVNRTSRFAYFTLSLNDAHVPQQTGNNTATPGQWQHLCGTWDGSTARIYIDGELRFEQAKSGSLTSPRLPLRLGHRNGSPHYYNGKMDEVAVFDHALTQLEIREAMGGIAPPELAAAPSPADGATDVARDAALSWISGTTAGTHDVYLGKTLADVNNASRTKPAGVLASQGQAATTYAPAALLDFGRTYYWRIDEVNKAPDNTVFTGSIWSFTVEPFSYLITGVTATASSAQAGMVPENTINGSGLAGDLHGNDGMTMWLSTGAQPNWIQYQLDKVYKLYDLKVWNSNQMIESFIGFGAKDVKIEHSTDGTTWTELKDVPQFARAPGLPDYAANTTVNFGGVLAKYVKLTITSTWGGLSGVTGLAEVQFSHVPTQAFAPQPAAGATGQSITTILSWRPGREAGSHKVFFGADPNAVAKGTVAAKTVTDHTFDPGTLAYGTTYYWKVDEVNTVTYPGDVWSFTTTAYGVVEDHESYNDKDNCIFDNWIDGVTDGKSGSQVGYDLAPFAERTIVHGGKQSMPLKYDNTAKFSFSEATRTFATAQNWTANGIKSLSLWFRGATANTGGQLYLKINGAKVAYDGAAGDLAKGIWIPWNIDLSAVGVSVSKVTALTIGIEGAGSKGIVYVDDIRIYPKTPEYITPVDPGKTNLAGLWTLDGNANDTSGKGNNGTVNGTALWVNGMIGQALQFNGTTTYVDCGSGASLNPTDAITITAWIKMDFTAGDRKIAGNQDGTTGGYKLGLYSNNFVEFEIRTSTNQARLTRSATSGGTALEQGVWYHVAGVYGKGQGVRTYVFGNLDREFLTTDLLGTSMGTFKLGREPMSANYYWMGALDDVRVYNKTLSQEELLWLAGQTKPVAKPF